MLTEAWRQQHAWQRRGIGATSHSISSREAVRRAHRLSASGLWGGRPVVLLLHSDTHSDSVHESRKCFEQSHLHCTPASTTHMFVHRLTFACPATTALGHTFRFILRHFGKLRAARSRAPVGRGNRAEIEPMDVPAERHRKSLIQMPWRGGFQCCYYQCYKTMCCRYRTKWRLTRLAYLS